MTWATITSKIKENIHANPPYGRTPAQIAKAQFLQP